VNFQEGDNVIVTDTNNDYPDMFRIGQSRKGVVVENDGSSMPYWVEVELDEPGKTDDFWFVPKSVSAGSPHPPEIIKRTVEEILESIENRLGRMEDIMGIAEYED